MNSCKKNPFNNNNNNKWEASYDSVRKSKKKNKKMIFL